MVRLYQMGWFFASPRREIVVYNKDMQRKTVILVLVALAILVGGKLPLTQNVAKQETSLNASISTEVTPSIQGEALDNLYLVVRVVDGDTIIIGLNGKNEKIRLIGVNTPEVVDPRKPIQCFGKEASLFTRNLLEGKQIRLEGDSSQGDRDKYGRLLRYVFLPAGTFVNKEIIAQGYGHEYTYHTPYHYQTDFKTAERSARAAGRGLWSLTACN